jgi:hypothetical protein
VLEGFEILFVEIAAPRHEQKRTARRIGGIGPVQPADGMSIGRDPAAFPRQRRDGAAIERTLRQRRRIPNFSLLPLVTL